MRVALCGLVGLAMAAMAAPGGAAVLRPQLDFRDPVLVATDGRSGAAETPAGAGAGPAIELTSPGAMSVAIGALLAFGLAGRRK